MVGNTLVTSIGGQVGWTTFSDRRLKTNINKSKLGLNFILSLNPVNYEYKAAGQKGIIYTGLIAQEVDESAKKEGEAFSGVDKNGEFWGIRYGELTVPLIKAVQELEDKYSSVIEKLTERLTILEQQLNQFSKTEKENTAIVKTGLILNNQPNPFAVSTIINYMLPADVLSAQMLISDINGKAYKKINLAANPGKSMVTLQAGELVQGSYTCTLLINGKLADASIITIIR